MAHPFDIRSSANPTLTLRYYFMTLLMLTMWRAVFYIYICIEYMSMVLMVHILRLTINCIICSSY